MSDLRAGRVAGAFGLRGELKIAATRIGEDSLRAGLRVQLRFPDGTQREAQVAAVRLHQGRPLARFDGVDDATAAEALLGAEVFIARAAAVVAEGEHLDADLIGCVLVAEDGTIVGEVVDVAHYPAQDMLVVGAARAYVPLVRAFIAKVDTERKRIDVTLPPGLLDPENAAEA